MISISNLSNMLRHFYKGEDGEKKIGEAISKLLHYGNQDSDNFYLIPKYIISNPVGRSQFEIDLLLFHPILGVYVIEIKAWDSLRYLSNENNPYVQVNRNKDVLMTLIRDKFDGELPINVESRVLYSNISRKEGLEELTSMPYFDNNCKDISFFIDDLDTRSGFTHFFHSSSPTITTKKYDLETLLKLLIPPHVEKNKSGITPIISPNELLFMDQKQLGILNSYTSGFRILRGVAGTGKTAILANFVNNRLDKQADNKFLILCFNKNLVGAIKSCFSEEHKLKNIHVYSIYQFLNQIKFEIPINIEFSKRYEYLESDIALTEFREKLREYLNVNHINYALFDETQDLPAGITRIIYEEIYNNNCIFFIDEAQKFFGYSMDNISDVFHHPKFEKIYMKGKVSNLKNVYRAPSSIAKCAFEILSKDNSLNTYYKKSHYLIDNFENDINCVLQGGNIIMDDFEHEEQFKNLIKKLPKSELSFVLYPFKTKEEQLKKWMKECHIGEHVQLMTMQSCKGLEANNIILYNFDGFLKTTADKEASLFYRKIYVLLTRSQENLYISCGRKNFDKEKYENINKVMDILKHYSSIYDESSINTQLKDNSREDKKIARKLSLAKLSPIFKTAKEHAETLLTVSEIFKLVSSFIK